MTLAADGHFVKVHQMIVSLASPYLKELIKSAQPCSHPVIFLNVSLFVFYYFFIKSLEAESKGKTISIQILYGIDSFPYR